jgi:hypothetical protein
MKLDKFENNITGIALKLLDEKIDPQDAAMDILDAVNERSVNESLLHRAGMWDYDPYIRALEILESELPEDAFSDMRDKMSAKADEYLKGRDSSLSMADHEQGAAPIEEPEANTMLGKLANQLDTIRKSAIRDNYQISRESLQALGKIVVDLKQHDKMASKQSGIGMRLKNLFSGKHSEDIGEEIEIMYRSALITESEATFILTENDIVRRVVPELRGIANNFVDDVNAQQRLHEIAKELSSL